MKPILFWLAALAFDGAHDWLEGQVYGGSGTRLSSTDTCRVCGLRRHFFSDSQNGVGREYRFSDGETGEDLTLRQGLRLFFTFLPIFTLGS